MGALPEDSSRGVGAVEVPEKRRAAGRYLGRLGGDLIFLVILVLSAHLAAPGTPPSGGAHAECLVLSFSELIFLKMSKNEILEEKAGYEGGP